MRNGPEANVQGLWNGLGIAQQVAMAITGAANAAYFTRRAFTEHGARRLAAIVLVAVFAGIALDGALHLGDAPAGTAELVRRSPLLTASLVTSALLVLGAGR
jgi:hypothetical protein